jgi:hypothetical protein
LEFASGERINNGSGISAPVVVAPDNCATMCLLVRRSKCEGLFDENCGLTAGFLGPCCEDTDFARAVNSIGGKHAYHPGVEVIHSDRGTFTYSQWKRTHEFAAYLMMSRLLDAKWHPLCSETRKQFFSKLGRVPSKDQRTLATGYTMNDLLDAFLPVVDMVPEQYRPGLTRSLEEVVNVTRSL